MRLPTIVLGFAAATAALPTAVTDGHLEFHERDVIEIVTLERKAFLSSRDLELAASHGVDANEMFPHSVIRRRSGDEITIWVNNNYHDGEAPAADDVEETSALDKRQSARPNAGAHNIIGGQDQRICNSWWMDPDINLTRPESAFTGGAHAIISWGLNAFGYFKFSGQSGTSWTDVVIGGSNSGANARVSIKKSGTAEARMGTGDAVLIAQAALGKQVNYGNGWRAAAEGRNVCGPVGTVWEFKKTDKSV